MIEIKKATSRDIPEILQLYALKDIDDGRVLDPQTAERYFSEIEDYPDYKIYLCRIDGETIGTFSLQIMRNLAHMGAKSGLIEDVVVSDTQRSKGIGKQMMQFAIRDCREKGCYKVSLSSNLIRERAHEFYEKIGFKRHGYSFTMDLE